MCQTKCRLKAKKRGKPKHEVKYLTMSYSSFGDLLLTFSVDGVTKTLTYPEGSWVSKYTAQTMLEEYG